MNIRQFLSILCILVSFPFSVGIAQENTHVKIVSKEVQDDAVDEKYAGYRNSGILIKQNSKGVIFKSHLHDFSQIRIEMLDQSGKLIYEYSGAIEKKVDYNIAMSGLPHGRYILNFMYNEMLVVCNVNLN